MKKLYTSVLCMTLLAPIVAQAEICTDFDEDFNIIEFDCAEGVNAARERIAAEQKKIDSVAIKAKEQERLDAENKAAAERKIQEQKEALERAEREKQKALERAEREKQKALERAEREKQKALERAEREARAKQEALERKQNSKDFKLKQLKQDSYWNYVVGLGLTNWIGHQGATDIWNGVTLDSYGQVWNGGAWVPVTVSDARYDAQGVSIVPSIGARYYFKHNLDWFAQVQLSYTDVISYDLVLSLNNNNWTSTRIDVTYLGLESMLGYQIFDNTYLYGKLGLGYMMYEEDGDSRFTNAGAEINDTPMLMLGVGLEYEFWKELSAYVEAGISEPLSDTYVGLFDSEREDFITLGAGLRYRF